MAKHSVTTVSYSCDVCEKAQPDDTGLSYLPVEGGERVHVCHKCRTDYPQVNKLLELASALFYQSKKRSSYWQQQAAQYGGPEQG